MEDTQLGDIREELQQDELQNDIVVDDKRSHQGITIEDTQLGDIWEKLQQDKLENDRKLLRTKDHTKE